MSDELVMGNVYGYRAFGYTPDGLYPLHQNRDTKWTPGINEAVCAPPSFYDRPMPQHPGKKVPAESCRCGFWAFLTPRRTIMSSKFYLNLPEYVSGVVRASGIVQLHQIGMRAQKMEIMALYLNDVQREVLNRYLTPLCSIAEIYKVKLYKSRDEALKAFPPTYKEEDPKPIENWMQPQWAQYYMVPPLTSLVAHNGMVIQNSSHTDNQLWLIDNKSSRLVREESAGITGNPYYQGGYTWNP